MKDEIFLQNLLSTFFCYRYMEKHKVYGVILVSACITDLGSTHEKASGKNGLCILVLQKHLLSHAMLVIK